MTPAKARGTDGRPSELGKGAELALDPAVMATLRAELPAVADRTVEAITAEVPGYAGALRGAMGQTIASAVQLALGGFLDLASRPSGSGPSRPVGPALEGAYRLGRGEARSGRSLDALLAAYRVGARVSWQHFSSAGVAGGLDSGTVARFAELVFAYIDQLSAASVSGHADELAQSGRVRARHLERLAQSLIGGAPADVLGAAAQRAEWVPPRSLTAVLVPERRVRGLLARLDPRTLAPGDDVPGLPEGDVVLLVPDAGGAARARLRSDLQGSDAVVGPASPWASVSASFDRAVRARRLGLGGDQAGGRPVDTDEHLASLLLAADPLALADLRARVLAPLSALRPTVADKLTETLRSWLLNHGRRDHIAAELFVHPQTVRYRLGQLRELYGDRLDDPQTILELTIALA
ncbi:PucR family transcriptional regulator [Intrasporangium oryzae]|uniref:PucR family transcriptional regulator n=1 Tax=Intrasporangium oryzae TaxID=412687 RepID=UPI0004B5D1D2|nr:helix-turn-helix domain-containing protein [Intrasporangium oryzae]